MKERVMSISQAMTPRSSHFLSRLDSGSPLLARTAIVFLLLCGVTYAMTGVDPRQVNGVSGWEKPAKFFLSLALHTATLAWGLSLLDETDRRSRFVRYASNTFVTAAAIELAYLSFQASRGEASHFNVSTTFTAIMYPLMGIGAVTLTVVTALLGWRIMRARKDVMGSAAGWGFVLAAVSTTLVAGYLSSMGSHWIGGDQTDATGLPFFHWSTTGGDLRVAHFACLHIMQALPLVAWFFPDKRVVAVSGFTGVIAVALLAVQALMGIPLLAG
jgi:uncharacterized membrane protein